MTTIVKHQSTVIRQRLAPQLVAIVDIVQSSTLSSDTSSLIVDVVETPEQERQAWATTSLEGLDQWEEQHRQ